ncbi:MAG TPA: VOC family protein [Solirubrobacteraceae bacterium]
MIHHVALEIREADAAAAERFWALLGFARVDTPPTLAGRAVWLEREGTQVHLLYADDPVAPPSGHVAVVAPDYDATLERLRAAGFEPDPRPEHWGAPRSFVRAPGGHRVEVMSRPPAPGAFA